MLRRVLAAASIATVTALPVEAACRSRDLVGTWTMSVVAFASEQAFVGYCEFTIAPDGDLSGSCEAYDLEDSFKGDVAGNWRVSPGCLVRGTFATQPDVRSDVRAGLNVSKDVITGISLDPGTINQFTATKIQQHRRARAHRHNMP